MADPVITLTVTKDGDQTTQNVTITGGGGFQHIEDTVPDASTDRQVNCAIDVSALKMAYILSDQALTLEANDGSSADYTITLAANSPFVWYTGCGLTNPFTADTTEFFVTNASGSNATLDIYIDQDPTP